MSWNITANTALVAKETGKQLAPGAYEATITSTEVVNFSTGSAVRFNFDINGNKRNAIIHISAADTADLEKSRAKMIRNAALSVGATIPADGMVTLTPEMFNGKKCYVEVVAGKQASADGKTYDKTYFITPEAFLYKTQANGVTAKSTPVSNLSALTV